MSPRPLPQGLAHLLLAAWLTLLGLLATGAARAGNVPFDHRDILADACGLLPEFARYESIGGACADSLSLVQANYHQRGMDWSVVDKGVRQDTPTLFLCQMQLYDSLGIFRGDGGCLGKVRWFCPANATAAGWSNGFNSPDSALLCQCAPGYADSFGRCVKDPPVTPKDNGPPPSCPASLASGNPVNLGTGLKHQAEPVYAGAGPYPLAYAVAYNSRRLDSPYPAWSGAHGSHWTGTYERRLAPFFQGGDAVSVVAWRPDGRAYEFRLDAAGGYAPDADVSARLERLADAGGAAAGWRYTDPAQDETEAYDRAGRLLSVANRAGLAHSLAYDAQGRLVAVSDPFGRRLAFGYDALGRIATMADPGGGVYRFGYDGANNLASVRFPDGAVRQYLYEDPGLPHHLTGLVDENGARFASWTYDGLGRALSSEHAGGAERVAFAYGAAATAVTGPLGAVSTHGLLRMFGVTKLASSSQPCGAGCAPASIAYDANGNLASRADFNGNLSCHAHDPARNLETVRVEGLAPGKACPADLAAYTPAPGTAERKVATAWHPAYRLPTRIDEDGRSTLFDYDGRGNLVRKTVLDPATGKTRAWAWTYDANGQVLAEDGPRTDIGDTTAYAYDDAGNLSSVRNPAGHLTYYGDYDAHGRPGRISDLNGHVTVLAYDARGRLASRTEDGRATAYAYDAAGQLVRLALPDGAFYAYAYDAAHRLADIADAAGNRIHYTLDAAGNRVREDVYDAAGALARTRGRVYDSLSRLAGEVGAQGQATRYEYDANGNLARRTDPAGRATAYAYDALGRLSAETDALGGATAYGRDALDRLVSVTGPDGLSTAYQYDGLGNLLRLDSPGTGTTLYAYDDAGNLVRRLDANGVETLHAYDALGRVRKDDYPGTADDVSYVYDYWSPSNAGVGRLYKASRGATALKFAYDPAGRVTAESLALPGLAAPATAGYRYDAAGRLAAVAYPSGARIDYRRGASGEVEAVTLTRGGRTETLAGGLRRLPFGPLRAMVHGNGLAWSRDHDLDGRPVREALGALRDLGYARGPDGSLEGLADNLDPAGGQAFGYDGLGRLAAAAGPYGGLAWAYDAAGNRLAESRGGQGAAYAYEPGSGRLAGAGGAPYAHDAAGNAVQAGGLALAYGPDGTLRRALRGGAEAGRYAYDPLGRRLSKAASGKTTYFLHGPGGELLAELDAAGAPEAEHAWLDGQPLAVVRGGRAYHVHPDPLGTPRLVTDAAGAAVWRWGGGPFGDGPAEADPDGDGAAFEYNLRFPGQYYDAETGLHYNMARYYDPSIGRYLESDPVGLEGGINTYAYAENNPVNRIDPTGLTSIAACANPANAAACAEAGITLPKPLPVPINTDQAVSVPPEKCPEPCPPCKTVSGKIVSVGTVGYRPLDIIPDNEKQHGVYGSHHNIFIANQIPYPNCDCFWQKQKWVAKPHEIQPNWIPIEPFLK